MARRHLCPQVARFLRDDAVTPVIGSILILAITILGIAGILLWGAPTLQSIQDQNAQVGMVGEFQEMRRDTLVLSITDSSRVPRVNQEAGSFGVIDGTRIQVSAMHDGDHPSCDFHVTEWGSGSADTITYTATSCRDTSCDTADAVHFEVFSVTGGNTVERTAALPAGASSGGCSVSVTDGNGNPMDITKGDWRFRLSDDSLVTYADAWLLSTRAIDWSLKSERDLAVRLEGGAIFSRQGQTLFLEQPPAISEEAFGDTADFVLRLPTYSGSSTVLSGRGSPSVFLGLVGNHLRVSADSTYTVRFDFQGEFSEGWCNGLKFRNSQLEDGQYEDSVSGATGACGAPVGDVWSLKYTRDDGAAPAAPDPFAFEFIHARITTSIQA